MSKNLVTKSLSSYEKFIAILRLKKSHLLK